MIGEAVCVEMSQTSTSILEPQEVSLGILKDIEGLKPSLSDMAMEKLSQGPNDPKGEFVTNWKYWVVDGEDLYEIEL